MRRHYVKGLKLRNVTGSVRAPHHAKNYDAGMVTARIGRRKPRRLFLTEWRKHFDVSPELLADRINVTRQTIHRWEAEQHRLTPDKLDAYAFALGIEPTALWRSPETPSIDELLMGADEVTQKTVIKMLSGLLKTGS